MAMGEAISAVGAGEPRFFVCNVLFCQCTEFAMGSTTETGVTILVYAYLNGVYLAGDVDNQSCWTPIHALHHRTLFWGEEYHHEQCYKSPTQRKKSGDGIVNSSKSEKEDCTHEQNGYGCFQFQVDRIGSAFFSHGSKVVQRPEVAEVAAPCWTAQSDRGKEQDDHKPNFPFVHRTSENICRERDMKHSTHQEPLFGQDP